MKRLAWVIVALVLIGAALAATLLLASDDRTKGASSKPETEARLLRVTMYTFALSTGEVTIDLQAKRLVALGFVIGEPEGVEELKNREWSRVRAPLTESEAKTLRDMATGSAIRGFRPATSDIKHRRPHLDECPPRLILTWSDRVEAFGLPLSGTVREDAPARAKECYKTMDAICEYLWLMARKYDVAKYYDTVSFDSPAYKQYVRERDGSRAKLK